MLSLRFFQVAKACRFALQLLLHSRKTLFVSAQAVALALFLEAADLSIQLLQTQQQLLLGHSASSLRTPM